jgi:hypothetical protein
MALPVASVATPEIEASPCAHTGAARDIASNKMGRRRRKRARKRARVMAFPRPGVGWELGIFDSINRFRMTFS